VVTEGEVRLGTSDLMGDEDALGLGVGCNGVIDVLLEPLIESFRPAVEAVQAGRDALVATVLESSDDRLALGDRAHGPAFDGFPEPVATALS
jgi:xanthine dehydrogenase accessory factor